MFEFALALFVLHCFGGKQCQFPCYYSNVRAMAKVQVLNIAVLDNPSPFGNPFQFEVTFECMEDLPEGEY